MAQKNFARGGGNQPPIKEIPNPRPVSYFDNERLIPAMMDDIAERSARELQEVTTTQLRRFYDDVLTLRQRLKAEEARGRQSEEVFAELRADFKMLKAKAVYANGRSQRTFPRSFMQFFIDHVAAVNTARDFEAFCKHFQAVVAFHRFYGKQG